MLFLKGEAIISTIVWLTSAPGVTTIREAFAQTDNNNLLTCWGYAANIVGTPGSDTIGGTPRQDIIVTVGGDDSVRAQGGDDFICGGPGNDRLFSEDGDDGMYDDVLGGDPGNDNLRGGDDNDDLYGDPNINSGNGGPGADFCNDVETIRNCEDTENA